MELTPINVAKAIYTITEVLKSEGAKITPLIKAKADAMSNYDKAVGVAIFKLKEAGNPVSNIDKLAKSECSDYLKEKVLAEELLKAQYSRIDTLKAQLNAYQSMNRYLDVLNK